MTENENFKISNLLKKYENFLKKKSEQYNLQLEDYKHIHRCSILSGFLAFSYQIYLIKKSGYEKALVTQRYKVLMFSSGAFVISYFMTKLLLLQIFKM